MQIWSRDNASDETEENVNGFSWIILQENEWRINGRKKNVEPAWNRREKNAPEVYKLC